MCGPAHREVGRSRARQEEERSQGVVLVDVARAVRVSRVPRWGARVARRGINSAFTQSAPATSATRCVATRPRFQCHGILRLCPNEGYATEGGWAVYQVVGFLAVGAAGAAVLHSWDLPKFVTFGFVLLSLGGAAVVGASQTGHVSKPIQPVSYSVADVTAPTEGFVAPPRRQKSLTGSAAW